MKMTYSELLGHRVLFYPSMTVRSFEGVVPPHFFGEMAKTEFGRQTLHEKGHFPEFALFIRQHGQEKEDPELILKLKSILWTVVRRQP
jgi:rapamycin-insensitive companion of mTOR